MNLMRALQSALMLLLLGFASGCTSVATTPAQFGHPVAIAHASRTIILTPRIRYVHVYTGETVAFRIGEKEIGWMFTVPTIGGGQPIDMGSIFPDIPEAKGIAIFIERSNLYRAG